MAISLCRSFDSENHLSPSKYVEQFHSDFMLECAASILNLKTDTLIMLAKLTDWSLSAAGHQIPLQESQIIIATFLPMKNHFRSSLLAVRRGAHRAVETC